jgi:hypothetical protein
MRALSLATLVVAALAACVAVPACSSSSLDGLPGTSGDGTGGDGTGSGGTGGDPGQAGTTTTAGQTSEAGAGGDGGDGGLILGADGCPVGDWREADGEPCRRSPTIVCQEFNECGAGPAEALKCSFERWEYLALDCGAVELGVDGCPTIDYRDADGHPCARTPAACPLTGCDIPLLLCVRGNWQYNYHESDCSPRDPDEAGSGGQGGAGDGGTEARGSGGAGGAP